MTPVGAPSGYLPRRRTEGFGNRLACEHQVLDHAVDQTGVSLRVAADEKAARDVGGCGEYRVDHRSRVAGARGIDDVSNRRRCRPTVLFAVASTSKPRPMTIIGVVATTLAMFCVIATGI